MSTNAAIVRHDEL